MIFFTDTQSHLPPVFTPHRLPSCYPHYHVYLMQNASGRRALPIHHKYYHSQFGSPYPVARPLIPPTPPPNTYAQYLDHISHFFWLPELGFRCITPPNISMTQHDPSDYLPIPFEMRLLGLSSPHHNLSYLESKAYKTVAKHLDNIYQQIYRRRAKLWHRYCNILRT